MKESEYWDLFCQTGKVDDYLHYACTSEESQHRNVKEHKENGRNCDGNGVSRVPDGRI